MGPSSVGGTYKRIAAVVGLSAAMAVPAALAAGAPALAYNGCQGGGSSTITVSSPVVNGGASITVTVTILNCDGSAAQGAGVVFGTQTGPRSGCQAGFNPSQATTNSNGVATTQAVLPAGCPCQYVLSASVPSLNQTLTTTVRENGCLPFTSTAAIQGATPTAPQPWTSYGVLIGVAALLILAATGVAIRRRT
jgi:hypothetical protein